MRSRRNGLRKPRLATRAWLALVVVVSLLPWRLAYACSYEQALTPRCCCIEPVVDCSQVTLDAEHCCKQTFAASVQLPDAAPYVVSSPGPDKAATLFAAAAGCTIHVPHRENSPTTKPRRWSAGTDLYLLTARLRL